MPKLTIDGEEITVADGTTVIQAAEDLGIFIPRYCYHPGLSIAGNCRICLVEVEKFPKLQIACNTFCSEGMVVNTKSDEAEQGRRTVLEFLLANHPLDCPVCDQSGECDLQDFYMNFGLYDSKFREHKVKKKKAIELGPHVMLDQERCILCSRCVRFTDEISKTGEFGIFNRGDKAELGIYPGEELNNPYSANTVDICPVGALTEKDFRFKVRVWYLSGAKTLCNGCSKGCSIDLHHLPDRPHLNDGARVVRIKPRYNADVNQWWLCDEGRYGFGWVDEDRLETVRGAAGGSWTWDEAMSTISAALEGARTGVIASAKLSNEDLFLIRELFAKQLGATVTAAVTEEPGFSDDILIQADKNPNTAGATLLGLAGPGATDAAELAADAAAGKLDVLWVFGHDLVALYGEELVQKIAENTKLFVYAGTNQNPTAELAHWVLPSAAYIESDGSFVNCAAHVQRIGRAFSPLADSKEVWRILLELGAATGHPFPFKKPTAIFQALAESEAAFSGLSYKVLGETGAPLQAATATAQATPG